MSECLVIFLSSSSMWDAVSSSTFLTRAWVGRLRVNPSRDLFVYYVNLHTYGILAVHFLRGCVHRGVVCVLSSSLGWMWNSVFSKCLSLFGSIVPICFQFSLKYLHMFLPPSHALWIPEYVYDHFPHSVLCLSALIAIINMYSSVLCCLLSFEGITNIQYSLIWGTAKINQSNSTVELLILCGCYIFTIYKWQSSFIAINFKNSRNWRTSVVDVSVVSCLNSKRNHVDVSNV